MSREPFYGWGRTTPGYAEAEVLHSEEEASTLFATGMPVIPRGLGRSYGDAAQVSGGVVMRNDALNSIGTIDEHGVVTVGSGVSIDALLRVAMPLGWFVPVTPGTRQVSIGGAVAADVHGKNHHVDGSFGHHVRSLRLATPVGTITCSPTHRPDVFWATVGGMGLTGVVLDVELQLLPISTNQVLVDTSRFNSLDGVMDAMQSGDHAYRYSVAWVDCMTKGARMGRAILTRGEHAEAGSVKRPTLSPPGDSRLTVPFDAPSGLLNPLTIRVFNELWFRAAPKQKRQQPQSIGSFFHPLDGVRDWNRLYGRKGFVQYQFAVGDHEGETVTRAIKTLSESGVPSFLAVLKRFGEGTPGPLSFPTPGWTLALDLPVGPEKLPGVLDRLDLLVAAAGGRVYLAKDSRLEASTFRAMYPRWGEFVAVKQKLDPDGLLTSDLARRLELVRK